MKDSYCSQGEMCFEAGGKRHIIIIMLKLGQRESRQQICTTLIFSKCCFLVIKLEK